MVFEYVYLENGYSHYSAKIPDIPVIYLAIRVGRFIARGPAIVDTGFDGGIYANMDIIRVLKGLKPSRVIEFEHPMFGVSEFEVYSAETFLYHRGEYVSIGVNNVYVPTEPELITEEVLVGREVLNKLKILLNPWKNVVVVETKK